MTRAAPRCMRTANGTDRCPSHSSMSGRRARCHPSPWRARPIPRPRMPVIFVDLHDGTAGHYHLLVDLNHQPGLDAPTPRDAQRPQLDRAARDDTDSDRADTVIGQGIGDNPRSTPERAQGPRYSRVRRARDMQVLLSTQRASTNPRVGYTSFEPADRQRD
jgi:hypothetical protein